MKKQHILAVLTVLCISLLACERGWRDQGGKTKPLGAPEYASEPETTLKRTVSHVAAVAPSGAGPDGASLYAKNCAACHQATGQGIPSVFPPLDASSYVTGDDVGRLAAIMIYGLMGPINVNGTTYNSVMAPLGTLGDDELAAIATYVRSAWSNEAGPVEASVFAETRTKWGARSMFQISELGEETS